MSDQLNNSKPAGQPNSPLRQVLHIGRILRAHGLRGELKLQSMSSDPDRFDDLRDCLMISADEKTTQNIQIEYVRAFQDQYLIKIKGIDDRTQAETLHGRYLSVRREQAVALPPDNWFICDLVGCNVFDEKEGLLGTLTDVLQHSAQDVYVVHQKGLTDLLFPALKTILLKVDIEGRRIDVRLPNGLFEVYRGRKT